MKRTKRILLVGVLPSLHLLLCLLAALLGGPDNWNWIWILILDMPVAFIVPIVKGHPLYLTLFGTVWWFLIGLALSFVVRRIQRAIPGR